MGRNLLNRSYETLGLDQKIWIKKESGGFGDESTAGIPVAGGAAEHLNFDATFNIPREDSASRSGRSVVVRLSKKKEVSFKAESYIIPGTPDNSGNPTLPPLDALILSAFGNVDLTDPAEIVYKLSQLNDKSFTILEEMTHYSRLIVGMVADSLTFNLPGDGKAQMSVEGFAQDVYTAGQSVLAQASDGTAKTASLVKADLTFTAVAAGQAGNNISIDYTTGALAGAEVVSVVGSAISVQIEDGVSTATQIKTALDAFPAAAALISTAITGVGGNPQSATGAAQYLSGGLGANDIRVSAGAGEDFEVGAYLDVIDKDDGETAKVSGAKITAVGTGQNADIITLGVASPVADVNDIVIGHAPATYTPISSENALLGLKGTFSVNGTPISCKLTMAEISLKNNFTKKDFLYGTSKICGYIPDKRRNVGVKLGMLLDLDTFNRYMRAKKFTAEELQITLEPQDIPAPSFTSSTGRTFQFDFPKVEFNIPKLEAPADKYVVLSLEGVALATGMDALDSEMTLTIK